MKKEYVLIIAMGLLFITSVIVLRDLQKQEVETEIIKFQYSDDYLFESFNLGLKVRDIFLNPLHQDKLYNAKCDAGKIYHYTLN